MWKNASFVLVALFWAAMNALLWHSEMGAGTDLASSVPAAAVWEKILTAPDHSALSINHDGEKLGFIRWRPNIRGAAADGKVASGNEPEGIVRRFTEYTVDIEGSLVAETFSRSLRFTGDLRIDRGLKWKSFAARLTMRPAVWRVKGNAEKRELWLEAEEDGAEIIRRLTFDDLQNPAKLLEAVDSPILNAMLAQNPALQNTKLNLGLNWTARYEWLRIGQSRVRVYRLTAKLLDRHEIDILVSRVGEILRVELPFEFNLVNDTLFEN